MAVERSSNSEDSPAVQQQAASLARAGHDVRVLTTLHGSSMSREESRQGYTVIRGHANNMIERRTEVPAVVRFDGIWLRLQIQAETLKRDKRQHKRQKRKGK